ncbi:MAG: type II secretion system F family protein [Pseudomonadota bacterium]|nr:type II secretion system F family protein [Pseudomonadota bacterium]
MQFAIQAIHRLQSVSLEIDAVDVSDARRQAEAKGYAVVAIRAARGRWFKGRGRPQFPLLQFNQSLLILLKAGLSIVEAIDTLAQRESRADARRILEDLRAQLGMGLSLSAALDRHRDVFPALYVAGVRANERSGGLVESIERFILYRAQADQLRKRIVGAAVYPALILGVGLLVIGFLLLFVIPRFSQVFEDMGDRIPAMSRLLLQWGRFVHAHGPGVLAAMVALVAGAILALRTAAVRNAIARRITRLPRIGDYVLTYQLARFYRALGLLQQAGIPILAALDMVVGLLPTSLHASLAGARRAIGEGRAISDAFEANGLTTVVAVRLLRVAESTGKMGEMLERTAIFHEDDIAEAIDWFIRLFEPALMIAIGLIIGVIVLLMYAPIFELAGSLQ